MTLLLANFGISSVLTGLIWTVQVVHYPLMARVGGDDFATYHARHKWRMTTIVAPLMLAEVVLAVVLVASNPSDLPTWIALALVSVCWLSTALIQVPLHERLAQGFEAGILRRLVTTNWIRTVAWTARSGLLAWMIGMTSS